MLLSKLLASDIENIVEIKNVQYKCAATIKIFEHRVQDYMKTEMGWLLNTLRG